MINPEMRPSVIGSGNVFEHGDSQGSFGTSSSASNPDLDFQLTIHAQNGIGVSVVNKEPDEELVYAFMTDVLIEYQKNALHQVLDGSIRNIQIDNQV